MSFRSREEREAWLAKQDGSSSALWLPEKALDALAGLADQAAVSDRLVLAGGLGPSTSVGALPSSRPRWKIGPHSTRKR